MANIAIYDKITNRIKQFLSSVNTPDYANRDDVLIDPNISLLESIPLKYWKNVGGIIKEMTLQEKAAVEAELAAILLASIRASGKDLIDAYDGQGIILRAIADIIKDELNIIRQWVGSFKSAVNLATSLADLKTRVSSLPDLPDRDLSQLKTAIKSRIDSSIIDH